MTTLTDFLLARIAEDESVAREAVAERARVQYVDGHEANEPDYADTAMWSNSDLGVPAVVVGPERVLAECEAKRRIVERSTDAQKDAALHNRAADHGAAGVLDYSLRSLALPYADHPDYREEWRP